MPWKLQDVITRIAEATFTTKPDGLPGNKDLAATSGVYVWNASAFIPQCPAWEEWSWEHRTSEDDRPLLFR